MGRRIELLFVLVVGSSVVMGQKQQTGQSSATILVRDPSKYPICISDHDCESISEKEIGSNKF